jgi:hypothetical protein
MVGKLKQFCLSNDRFLKMEPFDDKIPVGHGIEAVGRYLRKTEQRVKSP